MEGQKVMGRVECGEQVSGFLLSELKVVCAPR